MFLNKINNYNTSEFDFYTFLFENDFKAILPELFLVIAVILLLVYGVIYSTSSHNKYCLLLNNISMLSLLGLIFTFSLSKENFITHASIFYNTLVLDDFTYFLKQLVICSVFFCILISLNYMKKQSFNNFEYIILLLLSVLSMLFLISSADFISMYLAIELQSLCFYVLAASKRSSEFSTEAGLKYFLLGAFSSGILLFGISIIYGFTGITNFNELAKLFANSVNDVCEIHNYFFFKGDMNYAGSCLQACELGMIFILVGFLFKLTAVPFHMWAPDVYEGAPTSVTAFFSITPKISFLAILIKVFNNSLYDFMVPMQKILIFSSIASMILACFAAMSQNKIKRLLAFSSIGHVGYLLIGVCSGTTEGLQAVFIYLVIYIIMTINIFAIILSTLKRDENAVIVNIPQVKYISDLTMLAKTNPILALTFTLTMFSIAGIPPLAGFYSKAYLFFAAMSSTMYLVAIIGVLTSVISCFYYIRLIKIMFFEKTRYMLSFNTVKKENAIILGITFFFIVFFMLFPTPLYLVSHKFAVAISC
jgi:proton-translocating NADH-quinone oxidoreductase chain N|uniref:NADH dehydrogenase subunit 2 n=1 Tax=Prasiola crispa TaxID=173492 RepID=A0A0R8RTD0_PRACR|nr:NADH dehydrogenase subunit 2 [Prasiola crispa]